MIAYQFDILINGDVSSLLVKGFTTCHGRLVVGGFFPHSETLLSDRLHVPYVFGAEAFGEVRDESEADGGFTHVLFSGGYVDGTLVADCGGVRR